MNEEQDKPIDETEEDSGMNFLEHIDELRKRLLYVVIFLIIACAGIAVFINEIMDYVLLNPANAANLSLQNLKPFGIPFLYFKVILVSGVIVSFPFILYQLWRFIAPGLYQNEKSWARAITIFTSICFIGGVLFAYFVMIPSMLSFAASFGTDKIRNDIDVNEYFSFVTMILLAAGVLFEMPMISYVLSKAGFVNSKMLKKYRKHAIVGILILAAVLTPTPDPISQLIFAIPLFFLYEISIIVSKAAYKNREVE